MELRRDSIMIFGLLESIKGFLAERKDQDGKLVQDVYEEVDMVSTSVRETYRIGKMRDGKCRPLKVKLNDQSSKQESFKKARGLWNSTAFKVFLSKMI